MPYCPECHQEQVEESASCPLDGQTYRVRRCAACGSETAPGERWCIDCGASLDGMGAEDETVPMARASWGSRALGVTVDVLCLSYLESAVPLAVETFLVRMVGTRAEVRLLLSAAVPVLYFALLTWGGRRTVGQQVMGIAVLTRDRLPLPLGRSLVRAVLLSLVLAGVGVGALAWVSHLWPDAVLALSGTPWGGWIRLALAPGAPPLQGLLILASLLLACSLLLPGRRSLHDRVADSDVFAVDSAAPVATEAPSEPSSPGSADDGDSATGGSGTDDKGEPTGAGSGGGSSNIPA